MKELSLSRTEKAAVLKRNSGRSGPHCCIIKAFVFICAILLNGFFKLLDTGEQGSTFSHHEGQRIQGTSETGP